MFKTLTTMEHMVLLMMLNRKSFEQEDYKEELESLHVKTYLHKTSMGYKINSRGLAFGFKQRSPHVDIQDIINIPSIKFKQELLQTLQKSLEIENKFDTIITSAMKKANRAIVEKEEREIKVAQIVVDEPIVEEVKTLVETFSIPVEEEIVVKKRGRKKKEEITV